ncbi:type I restriction endonuclease subunit R [Mycoplasma feriruminatoris]|uniref:Type I restriction enzyme endonuclease subunit n=2 Tax=Mycoplasma feriruminatoris TaxID=1179777 RepID=A0ABY8HW29_9MOLU|nr:HsdR family type I site-specific deoxyribonuclease [Mycoplasma feriruminatoris]WFQ93839.1 type I restriction endonuclease subunit R [Mycoplasma feriruminatoris]
MDFVSEKDFENAVINNLKKHGWKGFPDSLKIDKNYDIVLQNVDEKKLIQNWKNIIFAINKDALNGVELSEDEMDQVIQKVNNCRSFVESNSLINNEIISIRRTNGLDQKMHGKEVQIQLFRRQDVNAGYSVYQIAQQIKSDKLDDGVNRRGDLMLLFNGMPLIHIELKNSRSLAPAITQLKNYSKLGFYKGIFRLVQIVVAMTPYDMMYAPNSNDYTDIKKEKFLRWTDENNNLIGGYLDIINQFFQIPQAHRLVADFTIADTSDNVLKVLRSYQIYAINKIQAKFFNKEFFSDKDSKYSQKGGYIWHTTGSGKTLTSFKLSTLLLEWNQADIVVFVVDRIELGTQTKGAFKDFNSSGKIEVIEATSANHLVKLLSSQSPKHQLIITSIHKQSKVNSDNYYKQLQSISNKRIVFIFDEAHRTTFGDMFRDIIKNIPNSVIFGFTGTPIFKENNKNEMTTESNFGPLLHKYTMNDGIKDEKVLGFSCEYVLLDRVLLPAIEKLCSKETNNNEIEYVKNEKLNNLQNLISQKNGAWLKYEEKVYELLKTAKEYKEQIVEDILSKWASKSVSNFFSAILTTSSIQDAIEYFDIFKRKTVELNKPIKFTALFDRSTDISEDYDDYSKGNIKLEEIKKIISRYNDDFKTNFDEVSQSDFANFKVDIQNRLARKNKFISFDLQQDKLDLLIVVNQLLTGYDSKYINTVYFDRKLEHEHLIQAISRTNRIFDKSNRKPFGNVIFYKQPGQMRWNVDQALALYTGINPVMGAPMSLNSFYKNINDAFEKIKELFESWGFPNFESVPDTQQIKEEEREEEAKLFLNEYGKIRENLRCAEILGFVLEENNEDVKMTYNDWDLIKARIKDIDFLELKEKLNEPDEIFLTLELADAQNRSFQFIIDNNYLKQLLANRNQKKQKNEITEEYKIWFEKELNDKFISKFPKEYQQIARDCLNSLIFGFNKNQININEFDLKTSVIQKIQTRNYLDISNFANEMNINHKELKSIIDSNEPINAYGRLDDLCNGRLTEEVKQNLAKKSNKDLTTIKYGVYKKIVKDFIKQQREKTIKI